jgi:hypothetical protein
MLKIDKRKVNSNDKVKQGKQIKITNRQVKANERLKC